MIADSKYAIWFCCAIIFTLTFINLIVPIQANDKCTSVTDCHDCTKILNCVWCSMEHRCMDTLNRSSCFQAPVTYFELQQTLESYKKHASFIIDEYPGMTFNRTPIETCYKVNLLDFPHQCPNYYLKLDENVSNQKGATLTDPIYPSMRINIFNRTKQLARDVPMSAMTVVPGLYFMKKPKYNRAISFFSINHDALKNIEIPLTKLYFLPFVMSDKFKFFSFIDVSIDGPRGDYQLGYAAGVRFNGTMQCLYMPSNNNIQIESNTYSFVMGLDNILTNIISVIFWILGAAFLTVLILRNVLNIRTPNGTIIHSDRRFEVPFLPRSIGKYKIVQIIFSIFYVSKENIIKYCGAEAYMFLTFEQSILFALFLMSIISLIILPFDWIHEFSTLDMASWSIAALNPGSIGKGNVPQNPLVAIHFFGYFCYMVILFGLGVWFNTMAKYEIRVSHSISHRVLHFLGIQRSLLSESQLTDLFKSLYPKKVDYAFIAYNLEKLHPLVERKEKLERDIVTIREYNLKHPDHKKKLVTSRFLRLLCCCIPPQLLPFGTTDALSYKRQFLENINQDIHQFSNAPGIEGTGSAFVVFKDEESVAQAKRDFGSIGWKSKNSPVNDISIHKWYTKKAPHASDVAWENLGVTKWQSHWLSFRTIASIAFLMFITTGTVSFVEGMNSFRKVGQQVVDYIIESLFSINVEFEQLNVEDTIKLATGIRSFVFSLPTLLTLMNILLLGFTRTTITGARYPNYRKKEKKEMLVGMLMSFLNTFFFGQFFHLGIGKLVSFTTENVIYEFILLCKYFYQFSTYVLIVFKFLEMLFFVIIPLLVSRIKYGKWLRTYIPNFYVGTYTLRMMFFLMVAVWGPIIPFGPFLMFIFMLMTYIIDRILIFHFYHSTREYDGRMYEMLGKVMTWTVFIYPYYVLVCCLRYYNSKFYIVFAFLIIITSIIFTCVLYGLSIKAVASKPVVTKIGEFTEDYLHAKVNKNVNVSLILEDDQEEEEHLGEVDDMKSILDTEFVPGKEVLDLEQTQENDPLEAHLNRIEFSYQHPLKKYYMDGHIVEMYD